jgi:glycosyltransferase involved in cell wall biosynthesis
MTHIIENIRSKSVPVTRSAAMYYKTEPFFTDVSRYVHTNNWEILRAIEILTERGFSVDLIDRNNHSWAPSKEYDLFLGLGVGNSGKNFARYAKASKAKIRVLLSMGPQPDTSNELVLERYAAFQARTGRYAPPTRTVQDVTGDKFLEIMSQTDFIFNIGEKGNESYNSYLKYGKPILHFYPAVSPSVSYDPAWAKTRDRNTYLCFAGNGLICKGVDVVTEAFLKDRGKKLHICGPSEASYFDYYGDKLGGASNVQYHGFVEPGGSVFNDLASKCSFVVFHSSAEGCCTSVATAMRAGLVPVINPWTGILTDGCGVSISPAVDTVQSVTEAVDKASGLSDEEYNVLVQGTLKKSKVFTQEAYTKSYAAALEEVIKRL